MLDVTKTWHLESMTVTLYSGLLETTVILMSKLQTTLSEIMTSQAHEFIRLTSKIRTYMAGSTVVLFEKFITRKFISSNGRIISTKPFVETRIRSYECKFELLDSISDVCLVETIRIYLCKLPCKLLVSLATI